MRLSTLYLSLAVMSATAGLRAQWVTYTNQSSTRVSASASLVLSDPEEKDYAWGDLDKEPTNQTKTDFLNNLDSFVAVLTGALMSSQV